MKSREQYIKYCEEQIFVVVKKAEIEFIYLKETGKDTVEVAVMGVLKEYHRHGIGKELVKAAKDIAIEKEYSFLQVKTGQTVGLVLENAKQAAPRFTVFATTQDRLLYQLKNEHRQLFYVWGGKNVV